MKLLLKLCTMILLWGTYFLPVYSFEKIYRIHLTTPPLDLIGIYRDGLFLAGLLAVLWSVILLGLVRTHLPKNILSATMIIFYLLFYGSACTAIAWDYRLLFGNTWRCYEVFLELVSPHWYFYLLGALGLLFHYHYYKLIQHSNSEQ